MRENLVPESDVLKKYISYISFTRSGEGSRQFLVFPNPGAAIALHKKHRFDHVQKNTFRTSSSTESIQLLHTNRIDPVKVIDEGDREIITIVFRPFGINHFLKDTLDVLVESAGGEHSYIDIGQHGYSGFADAVFNIHTQVNQLSLIEDFLLKHLHEKEIPFVAEAIRLLTDFEHTMSIPDICKKIGTSSRNLSRLFSKHIVLTPTEFRNISRFRYSLNRKMESSGKALKEIGYESNYSDASYMIRMYKKYTGLNPSAFFEKVTIDSNYVFLSL